MLEHIYSSKSDLPNLDSGFPFFSADPPPTWRSEVEALAEMREVPCPRVKEEETAYHTSASQDREDEEDAGWGSDRAGGFLYGFHLCCGSGSF